MHIRAKGGIKMKKTVEMTCNRIEGGYCTSKGRNGFCHKFLILCGDDSVLHLDDYTKFKLKRKIYQEVKDHG